jgi:hypothetical protein
MRRCLFIFFICIGINACKTQQLKVVFLNEKEIAEVKVNSACRNSSIYPIKNEEELKNEIHNAVILSIKKMKFKTNSDVGKSTLKTNKVEYIINESCQISNKNQVYSFEIQQKISVENIVTKEIYVFESDTLLNNQQLNSNQLAAPKVDLMKFIFLLTENNYKQAKRQFSTKK